MVTFADMMTLLLALFVMLLSFAEIDSDSFRKNAGPISEAFNTKNIIQISPTLPKCQRLDLRMGPGDAELRAQLKEEFLDNLRTQMAREIAQARVQILVAGHTDNAPISTQRIRSNWDLSTQRAVSVVHHLLRVADIEPARISVQGFADSRPLEPHDTPEGRARNRRVEISVSFEASEDGES
jgi:chemotaxis protein MotB